MLKAHKRQMFDATNPNKVRGEAAAAHREQQDLNMKLEDVYRGMNKRKCSSSNVGRWCIDASKVTELWKRAN